MRIKEVKVYLTAKQSLAFRLLTNPDSLSLLFGGAKGGGKSFFLCLWVDYWVDWLIKFFELKYDPNVPPLPLGFMGRKQAVNFDSTTLETFKRVVPADHYTLHEQKREIIFQGVAKVYYGGLDDQDRIKKFNSAELAFLALDQAEETERTDVSVLQASLRLKHNGKQPPYKALYTSNPGDCWLKEDFIDNVQPGHHFIPALYTDNPHLPNNYADTLELAFRYNQAMLSAYKFGDWFALQSENSLISSKMLSELKDIVLHFIDTKRIIICDPSLGGDECVIYAIDNYELKETKILHERDTMKIAGEMVVMGERHHTPNYGGDTIGIGQGIFDRIRELKPEARVIYINSAERADDEIHFFNKRAEIAWHVMTLIQDRKIPYPEDEKLRTQLISYKFKVIDSNGKIQLEPKEKTKKRIGQSPDRADAFLMGMWGMDQTEPLKSKDAWRETSEHRDVSSKVESAMTA